MDSSAKKYTNKIVHFTYQIHVCAFVGKHYISHLKSVKKVGTTLVLCQLIKIILYYLVCVLFGTVIPTSFFIISLYLDYKDGKNTRTVCKAHPHQIIYTARFLFISN